VMNLAIPLADDVETLLRSRMTYAQIAEQLGTSRGTVWRIALDRKARKNEARIEERRVDRERQMRENIEAALGETTRADALQFLSGLPSESCQAIISSPPYNVSKAYDADPTADAMPPLRYFGWLCEIIAECERILKPGGVIAMVVGATRDHFGVLKPIDWLLSEAFAKTQLTYQNRIAWVVAHGLTPKKRLANRYESIVIFSKGEPTFNPGAARTPTLHFDKRAFRGPNRGKASGCPQGAFPSDCWTVPHLGHNHSEKTRHPCAYPVAIPKRLMLLYSQPGDLICDFASGTGSTHVACIETHRAFIGCDVAEYADIRPQRIAAATPATFSPFPGVTPESLAFWQREIPSWAGKATPNSYQPPANRIVDDEQLVMDFVAHDLVAEPRRRARAASSPNQVLAASA
jgi:DNA modification methylase